MRYLLIFLVLFSSLFAHGGDGEHIHFFSTWHVEDFVILLVSLIIGLSLYRYFSKERS